MSESGNLSNASLAMKIELVERKLDDLIKSVALISQSQLEHSPSALMEYHHISDYKTHALISLEERWQRIRQFERIVRGLKEVYYIGKNEVMCRALGRYWMFFSGQDGYVAQHIMANGYWELSCTELVASEVQPGMRVIDAGANIGYFSVLMAEKIGPSGFLYVFEPAPSLKENLDKTLFLNGVHSRCKVVTNPLWDSVGQDVTFSVPVGDTKNSSILGDLNKTNDNVTLQTTTLDAVIPAGQPIDFMKVDVEGAEHHMWRGMQRVLADSPDIKIFLEFNAGRLHEPGLFVDDIQSSGFALEFLDPIMGAVAVSKENLLGQHFGEDWMLILKRKVTT